MVDIEGFIIDLDGTVYLGDTPIDGADDFFRMLEQNEIPYLLLTNNSTQTPLKIANKLKSMGIRVRPEHIYTSAMATADFLQKEYGERRKAFVIGEEGLFESLLSINWQLVENENEAEFVIVGLDRKLTYEKLERASLAVQQGAKFIACNTDSYLPTPYGFLPGSGAIVCAIETTTGVKPKVIGKPEPIIIEEALSQLGTPKEKTAIVGDRLETDIEAGKRAGIKTILVLTGAKKEEKEIKKYNPDYVFKDIGELWRDFLKQRKNLLF